jgi:hypothetical protein
MGDTRTRPTAREICDLRRREGLERPPVGPAVLVACLMFEYRR